MDCIVSRVGSAAADIRSIGLILPRDLPRFEPGGHVDVQVKINGKLHWRSYSIVGFSETLRAINIAVKRIENGRGGSLFMWSLSPNDRIKVRLKQNSFPVNLQADRQELLAGGIGITPIISIAQALKRAGKSFRLHYSVARRRQAAFVEELTGLLGDGLVLHVTEETGLFPVDQFVASLEPGTYLHMCGPLGLMNAIKYAWQARSFPSSHLRFENFGYSNSVSSEFRVRVASTGAELLVPANASLLDTLLESGYEVMYECMKGECGLCKVELLSLDGSIDHRDMFLGEVERRDNRSMCSCVSRIAGNAEISIDKIMHGRPSISEAEKIASARSWRLF
ncbi:hypothetical protein XI00_36040 [Bradyrhizobium sp. CCBAU 21359]|nr:hypothetical protein [Bradyrhizobium sp. CCBAU 21359]